MILAIIYHPKLATTNQNDVYLKVTLNYKYVKLIYLTTIITNLAKYLMILRGYNFLFISFM